MSVPHPTRRHHPLGLPVYVGPDEAAFAVRTELGGPPTLVRVSFDAFTPE